MGVVGSEPGMKAQNVGEPHRAGVLLVKGVTDGPQL